MTTTTGTKHTNHKRLLYEQTYHLQPRTHITTTAPISAAILSHVSKEKGYDKRNEKGYDKRCDKRKEKRYDKTQWI